MAIKMTVRGAPPAVIYRRLRCTDCEHVFEVRVESRESPLPECPQCVGASSALPSMPAVRASPEARAKVAAVEETWRMAQEDYGFTDMNDHMKPGDIVAKGPAPMHTADREAATRELVELAQGDARVAQAITPDQRMKISDFWQGGVGAGATTPDQLGAARAASQDAVQAGVDALSILEKGKNSGTMAPRYNVLARDELKAE